MNENLCMMHETFRIKPCVFTAPVWWLLVCLHLTLSCTYLEQCDEVSVARSWGAAVFSLFWLCWWRCHSTSFPSHAPWLSGGQLVRSHIVEVLFWIRSILIHLTFNCCTFYTWLWHFAPRVNSVLQYVHACHLWVYHLFEQVSCMFDGCVLL